MLNDGKPALVQKEEEPKKKAHFQGDNEGVTLVKDEIEERLANIRQAMAARGLKFSIDKDFNPEDNKKALLEHQRAVDDQFDQVMKEYNDQEIGEGGDGGEGGSEGDDDEMDFLDNLGEEDELVGDDEMNDALDEFIDQNKNRFRNLHHNFKEGED
jgi:hypothetical protein